MTQGSIIHTSERRAISLPGITLFFIFLIAIALAVALFLSGGDALYLIVGIILVTLGSFGFAGFYSIQPNEAVAVLLFGAYQGTDRSNGLRWVFPWLTRKKNLNARAQRYVR